MSGFKKIIPCLACLQLLLAVESVHALEIEVVTEATPFTILEPDRAEVGGEATEFVSQVLDRAGVKYEIRYAPWKRAYRKALNVKNVLVYPIAKTEEREDSFHWVGKLTPVRYYLFGLRERSDIKLSNLDSVRNYSLGVVNKHAHHEYLNAHGFNEVELVNSSAQNLRKLLLGRIDLFPLSSSGLPPLCEDIAVDCSKVVPKLKLDDFSDGLYMAFSKGSDPAVIEAVNNAYQDAIQEPAYQSILELRENSATLIEQQYQELRSSTN